MVIPWSLAFMSTTERKRPATLQSPRSSQRNQQPIAIARRRKLDGGFGERLRQSVIGKLTTTPSSLFIMAGEEVTTSGSQ